MARNPPPPRLGGFGTPLPCTARNPPPPQVGGFWPWVRGGENPPRAPPPQVGGFWPRNHPTPNATERAGGLRISQHPPPDNKKAQKFTHHPNAAHLTARTSHPRPEPVASTPSPPVGGGLLWGWGGGVANELSQLRKRQQIKQRSTPIA